MNGSQAAFSQSDVEREIDSDRMLAPMNQAELDFIKNVLKRKDDATKELWLEKQLLRDLILDSGWMSEPDLDAAIADGKKLPENIRHVEENFASSDQMLAKIRLADVSIEWVFQIRVHEKTFSRNLATNRQGL